MKEKYMKPEIFIHNISLENSISAGSANMTIKEDTISIEWQEEEQNQILDW